MSVLVGRAAPDFTAAAVLPDGGVVEDFTLSRHLGGCYGILFFWPLNFTSVCPSEIFAYDRRVCRLAALGAKLVGVSVDSERAHAAWRNTPASQGGIGPVGFPMVADKTKAIAADYGVLVEDAGVALRATFLIDRAGLIRHQLINDLPLGRNAEEAVRILEALRFHEDSGEACPADWHAHHRGAGRQKHTAYFTIETL
jgi:peroxiredoxin (alkyl hydroperoxide reductase subunit C)